MQIRSVLRLDKVFAGFYTRTPPRSLPRPWRVRIEAPPNRQCDFPHASAGKNPPFLTEQRPLGENLHVMAFHERWPWQTGFARSHLDYGRSRRSLTTEGNDQDGVPAVAEISLIERNDQHPMADWRITEIRGPDFSSARQRTIRQN